MKLGTLHGYGIPSDDQAPNTASSAVSTTDVPIDVIQVIDGDSAIRTQLVGIPTEFGPMVTLSRRARIRALERAERRNPEFIDALAALVVESIALDHTRPTSQAGSLSWVAQLERLDALVRNLPRTHHNATVARLDHAIARKAIEFADRQLSLTHSDEWMPPLIPWFDRPSLRGPAPKPSDADRRLLFAVTTQPDLRTALKDSIAVPSRFGSMSWHEKYGELLDRLSLPLTNRSNPLAAISQMYHLLVNDHWGIVLVDALAMHANLPSAPAIRRAIADGKRPLPSVSAATELDRLRIQSNTKVSEVSALHLDDGSAGRTFASRQVYPLC